MKFPQLRMESQMGRIRIEQTPARIEMRQPRAHQSIEQPKAEMNITRTQGKLTIDQTQAWEERNLMSTPRFVEKHAQESRQAIHEGVARRAEQGSQLVKIEQGGNVIAEQARENGSRKIGNFGIKYVPSPFSVKIHYEPGELNIDIQPRKPNIHVETYKPEISFERGTVNITMEQYPQLEISVVDLYA
jgi:hypothetical protein